MQGRSNPVRLPSSGYDSPVLFMQIIRPIPVLGILAQVLLNCLPLSVGAADVSDVRLVKRPSVQTAGGFYEPNRAPLEPTAFLKLPIGSITPKGWLRGQLEADANGIVGRMPEISDFLKFENTGWVHPEKGGWEEVTYWLRGFGDLGYVLKDERITNEARKWIEAAMATQDADGYFGPVKLKPKAGAPIPDPWAHMPMLHALRSYYEYSRDERVLRCLVKYFKWLDTQPVKFFGTGWAAVRWSDTLSSTYWLYNITGDSWLLNLSKKIQENSGNFVKGLSSAHNVNLAQGIRQPAEYWLQSHDPKHLALTEQHYQSIMGEFGQFAGGGFAGDEGTRHGYGDPRQGFETCGIVELMLTFETMSKISSDPVWADRNEEIAFNTFPAALTPDHKATHYITSANSIQLDDEKKEHQQFQNGPFPMQAFKTGVHQYRCCPHNYGMGWPYYAEELWLGTYDKGLCASLYAASEVKAKVGDGTEIGIAEETDYPFGDTVKLKVSAPKAVAFPLYLRVPRWCEGASIKVNGENVTVKSEPLSYVVIERQWRDGDTVTWKIPMKPSLRTWAKNGDAVSVDYGPLSFSLDLGEKWEIDNHPGQRGDFGTAAWPQWKVTATKPWNYGLTLDAKVPEIEVLRKPGQLAANPFTPETAPILLRVKARKIENWKPDYDNVVTTLQQSPAKSSEPVETVTLIPMGAARLRISTFPTVSDGPDAHPWVDNRPTYKLSSSRDGGNPETLFSQAPDPKASIDHSVPFFLWGGKRGAAQWVQCDYYKPKTASSVSVYWFDDKGTIRMPTSWRLLYKSGEEWKPVAQASGFGVEKDRYNRVTFKPVTTTGLRIEAAMQEGHTGGIHRWKIE